MKKWLVALASVFVLVAGGASVSAQNYVNQRDINAIDRAASALSEFETAASDADASIVSETLAAIRELRAIESHRFSDDLGSAYTKNSEAVKRSAGAVATSLEAFRDAAQSGDEIPDSVFTAYNTAIDDFNASIDTLNESVDVANTEKSNLYLYILFAAIGLTVGSFVWAFKQKEPTPERTKLRRQVAYASLIPLAGAGITYGTYQAADSSGGGYTVLWGVIVFGAVAYISAIVAYIKAKNDDSSTPSSTDNTPKHPPQPTTPPPIVK